MSEKAFFKEEDGIFVPLEPARGYWSMDSLHGRALVGLAGEEIERRHGRPGMVPARFHLDMHRLAPFTPIEIETEVVRDGNRLVLVEARVIADGIEQARGTCQFLKATAPPERPVWSPEPWDVPSPDEIAPPSDEERIPIFDHRAITGKLGEYGPRRIWTRETMVLTQGRPLTPFSRVAMLGDFVSPWVNGTDGGVQFINTHAMIHLHRLPRGEWLGLDKTGFDASQGISVGHCRLYDQDGPLGYLSCSSLANRKPAHQMKA